VLERTSRFISRAQRYLKSAYDTVCALLSIKTYRYLLGGENVFSPGHIVHCQSIESTNSPQLTTTLSILSAMSALYFTVTGVQFWGTKYLTVALHAPLPLVSTLFILCAATGPTLGVFFGGWVVDRLGGYKGAHQRVVALELCATFGVLAFVFSLPLTFLNNIFAVVGLLWVVLLFGGAMLPACSGIVVSIIPRAYRPTSSSLALMVFNMFGYFMSLLLSGMLMQVCDVLNVTQFHSSFIPLDVCLLTFLTISSGIGRAPRRVRRSVRANLGLPPGPVLVCDKSVLPPQGPGRVLPAPQGQGPRQVPAPQRQQPLQPQARPGVRPCVICCMERSTGLCVLATPHVMFVLVSFCTWCRSTCSPTNPTELNKSVFARYFRLEKEYLCLKNVVLTSCLLKQRSKIQLLYATGCNT